MNYLIIAAAMIISGGVMMVNPVAGLMTFMAMSATGFDYHYMAVFAVAGLAAALLIKFAGGQNE